MRKPNGWEILMMIIIVILGAVVSWQKLLFDEREIEINEIIQENIALKQQIHTNEESIELLKLELESHKK